MKINDNTRKISERKRKNKTYQMLSTEKDGWQRKEDYSILEKTDNEQNSFEKCC